MIPSLRIMFYISNFYISSIHFFRSYSRSASLCANTLGLPMYNMPAQSAPGSRRGSTTLNNSSFLTPNLPINDNHGGR